MQLYHRFSEGPIIMYAALDPQEVLVKQEFPTRRQHIQGLSMWALA